MVASISAMGYCSLTAKRPSAAAGQAGSEIAVDVDQRLQFRRIGVDLHLDGLLHHEYADVGDVLANLDRLLILFGLRRAHENRPQAAVEQQRRVEILTGTGPVGLDFLELSCGLQQRLRFDFTGRRRRLRRARVGLGCVRHSLTSMGAVRGPWALKLLNFHTDRAFKYG